MQILTGDSRKALSALPAESVHACVTSPPYFHQRDYGVTGQIGLEKSPAEFVQELVTVFREVRRVLRPDGAMWLNIGDSYASGGNSGGGSAMSKRRSASWSTYADKNGWREAPKGYKRKDLIGVSWMLANALQADGWWLRSCCIWDKGNAGEPVRGDRPGVAHEFVFLLSKAPHYWTDPEKMPRSTLLRYRPRPSGTGHPATMALPLVETCVLSICPAGGTVLDPFAGAGTTGLVASRHGRHFVGVELNPTYAAMARERCGLAAPQALAEPYPGHASGCRYEPGCGCFGECLGDCTPARPCTCGAIPEVPLRLHTPGCSIDCHCGSHMTCGSCDCGANKGR